MKKIVLAPIRNEGWILDIFLKNLAWADLVILADQRSDDSSREIAARYANVMIIDNPYEGHSNKVRWLLLDTAKAYVDAEPALVFCLDADEIITSEALAWTLECAQEAIAARKPARFAYPWIQLFGTMNEYRIDGVWRDNMRSIAFVDDLRNPKLSYPQAEVVNDHTERIPSLAIGASTEKNDPDTSCPTPVLHLHFLARKRSAMKQAWYMCQEILKSGRSARDINFQYEPALHFGDVRTVKTPASWLEGISLPDRAMLDSADPIRFAEIKRLLEQHGANRFEGLDIWHIKELSAVFNELAGRAPCPSTYPKLAKWLFKLCPKWLKIMVKSFLRSIKR